MRQDLLTDSLLPPLQILSADVLCGDLVGPLAQRIRGCVDLLVRSKKLYCFWACGAAGSFFLQQELSYGASCWYWLVYASLLRQVFNPPYVLTPDSEVCKASIAAAWAGGRHGRAVIDRFLPCVSLSHPVCLLFL